MNFPGLAMPDSNTAFSYRGYRIVTAQDDQAARSLVDRVLSNQIEILEVYRDNRNSFTAKCVFGFREAVIKVPRGKNRKRIARFFTLFRSSEPVRRYNDMTALRRLGINGPMPVLAAEKRSSGMVVDSFLMYLYIQGRVPESGDESAVLKEVRRLHRMGYTRKDSKPENFLVNGSNVYLIDFKLKRPVLFKKTRINMELAWLVRRMPGALDHIGEEERGSFLFRFGNMLDKVFLFTRTWRKKARRALFGPSANTVK